MICRLEGIKYQEDMRIGSVHGDLKWSSHKWDYNLKINMIEEESTIDSDNSD